MPSPATFPGISGSLLSHDALAREIPERLGEWMDEGGAAAARRQFVGLRSAMLGEMGPTCGPRAVFDRVAAPLSTALGFSVSPVPPGDDRVLAATLASDGRPCAVVLTTAWGEVPQRAWRTAVHHGLALGLRWCFCITGPRLRAVDARRTYARRFVDIDLEAVIDDERAFAAFWGLFRAQAFRAGDHDPLLDSAVAISEQHRGAVRSWLQAAVEESLGALVDALTAATRRSRSDDALGATSIIDESLVIVYRILFLLFAEARGLVPTWHPVYRDAYTIESLCRLLERRQSRGTWEGLQAIARLARHGCRAGTLQVPPFNGRLFSAAGAPRAEWASLPDAAVGRVLLSLTMRPGRQGSERVSYADLGVEQLGGIYERVLDGSNGGAGARRDAAPRSGRRKATGTFYTPRSLTDTIVRRTLAPLTDGVSPAQVLGLRVLDPAMGSGAFLVAACRYLAAAYESALVRAGDAVAHDLSDADRATFRRVIAQRCLYGVDVNPMAVQLARLSLWLTTLSGDRPLTFLDHHLRIGNSLVGASLEDVARQPPRQDGRTGGVRRRPDGLPLFDWADIDRAVHLTVGPRVALAEGAGDTLEQVRAKERLLDSLHQPQAPLAHWKRVADLWCAAWFRQRATPAAAFHVLSDEILGRGAVLPPHLTGPILDEAASVAARERFHHWTLEFPEVFFDASGRRHDAGGFDAVIGNPPWEMLRADHGADAMATVEFARSSGAYRLQGNGHPNMYQLFLERTLSLVRNGGRIGLLVPFGLAVDHGCAALRRALFDRTSIDTFIAFENRERLFPVHRSLKFLALTATTGARTRALPCRFGLVSADVLDGVPDEGPVPSSITIPRSLLDRFSGDQAAVPELRCDRDLTLVSRIVFAVPALQDPAGWGAAFGRELNASDDRHHFVTRRAGRNPRLLPVLEGKQIQPFAVDVESSRLALPAGVAGRLLDAERTYMRDRLGYRDVAASTNRLTLIAAIIPAGTVTTHTIFCLKTALDPEVQDYLCGIFNSFVANYIVRLRVTTHVTVAIIGRLPVPNPPRDSCPFRQIAALVRRLRTDRADRAARARLQGAAARLYGVSPAEFQHILDTFPLVEREERQEAYGMLNAD